MLGVAPAASPGDWALYDVDGKNGEHREMTREALEIMLRIWTETKALGGIAESAGTPTESAPMFEV